MTADELKRRDAILNGMDEAAYECAGLLLALVDTATITTPRVVAAAQRLRDEISAYRAVNAIDKAKGIL